MPVLPFRLPPGWMSLYGEGRESSLYGAISPNKTNWKFATIYGAWNEDAGNPLMGQSVMFNEEDVIVRLIYGGQPYTIVEEQKLGGSEIPLL